MRKITKHLTLLGRTMTRIFPLLLFIGLAWGQDSLDKLILKNGIEYLGKFEKEEESVIFLNQLVNLVLNLSKRVRLIRL